MCSEFSAVICVSGLIQKRRRNVSVKATALRLIGRTQLEPSIEMEGASQYARVYGPTGRAAKCRRGGVPNRVCKIVRNRGKETRKSFHFLADVFGYAMKSFTAQFRLVIR